MFLRLTACAGTAALAMLSLAPPAAAREPEPPISALATRVALGGDPWRPTGTLRVEVVNTGTEPVAGSFVLHLPESVVPTRSPVCRRADGPHQPAWVCGGANLPAGGRKVYSVPVRSTLLEPTFGTQALGWVAGRTADGRQERQREFVIAWPDRLPLRLAATAGRWVDGHVDVAVRVTNAGTFTLGGYSLNVRTPDGVRVTSPRCTDSGRMSGAGCEIFRGSRLKAAATDAFTVRLSVKPGKASVRLFLAPTNRYTNHDTVVTLRLDQEAATGPGTRPDTGPSLPRTGARPAVAVGVAAALIAVGALLVIGLRRRPRR
jgi:hypothetical protein